MQRKLVHNLLLRFKYEMFLMLRMSLFRSALFLMTDAILLGHFARGGLLLNLSL